MRQWFFIFDFPFVLFRSIKICSWNLKCSLLKFWNFSKKKKSSIRLIGYKFPERINFEFRKLNPQAFGNILKYLQSYSHVHFILLSKVSLGFQNFPLEFETSFQISGARKKKKNLHAYIFMFIIRLFWIYFYLFILHFTLEFYFQQTYTHLSKHTLYTYTMLLAEFWSWILILFFIYVANIYH